MRKRIKPLAILIFFASFITFILISKQITDSQEKQAQAKISQTKQTPSSSKKEETSEDSSLDEEFISRPIIDISGWQLPSEINYDLLAQNVSGVIVRVHSGAQAKKEKSGLLGEKIKWNFTKFLVSRDGTVIKRFSPQTSPKKIEELIQKLL